MPFTLSYVPLKVPRVPDISTTLGLKYPVSI